MDKPISAIVIHENTDHFKLLEAALPGMGVDSYPVSNSISARDAITQYQPLLVFVDLGIWRQSHAEIVEFELGAEQTFSIIVVGPRSDIANYVEAVGKGAFEFIAPPFSHDTLNRVVRSATIDAEFRREALAKVPQPYVARAAG